MTEANRDERQDVDRPDVDVFYCARHPHVETTLRCGRCDTPICPRCLVQTPVGARCPTCANVSRLPTFDVKPQFFARGLAAAVVVGAGVGWLWGTLNNVGGLFIIFFVGLGIGWVVSEAVSIATNRKRGNVLQGCAVAGVLVVFLVHNLVAYGGLLPIQDVLTRGGVAHQTDVWAIITAGIAAVFGASRLGIGR